MADEHVAASEWRTPVTLIGELIRLEPLSQRHVADLAATCADTEVLRWVIPSVGATPEGMQSAYDLAMAEQNRGTRLPFAQVRIADDVTIGSTSYLDVTPEHGRVEIGATFLSREVWRTGVNTESKLLMLTHAFDVLGCERVALKTDLLNERSQRAIERLGARREGVLRHHMQRSDGTWRDTVYYSILRDEWPEVRQRLTAPRA
jgi:RimJ/RimL family protein N-acetyltransferase